MFRHYKTEKQFIQDLDSGIVDKTNDIVFISDTRKIYTHSFSYETISESLLNRISDLEKLRENKNLENGDIPVINLSSGPSLSPVISNKEVKEYCVLLINPRSLYTERVINRVIVNVCKPGKLRLSVFNKAAKSMSSPRPLLSNIFVRDIIKETDCKYTGIKVFDLDEDLILEKGQYIGLWNDGDKGNLQVSFEKGLSDYTCTQISNMSTVASENKFGKLGIGFYDRTDLSYEVYGNLIEDKVSTSPIISGGGGIDPDPSPTDPEEPNNRYLPEYCNKLSGREIVGIRLNISQPGEIQVGTVSMHGPNGKDGLIYHNIKVTSVGLSYIQFPYPIKVENGYYFYIESSPRIWSGIDGEISSSKYSLGGYYTYSSDSPQDLSKPDKPGENTYHAKDLGVEIITRRNSTSLLTNKTFDVIGFSESSFLGDSKSTGNKVLYKTDNGHDINDPEVMWYHCLERFIRMKMRYNYSEDNNYNLSSKISGLSTIYGKNNNLSPDYIFVLFTSNDFFESKPLGNIEDMEASKGYYGTVYSFLSKIESYCPSSRIIAIYPNIIPDTVKNSAGNSQYLYIKAVRDVCELYSYEFIDNSYFHNISKALESQGNSTSYGILSVQGQEILYNGIKRYLNNLN